MKQRSNFQKLIMLMIILVLGLFCFSAASGEEEIAINETNFPDPVFREIVKDNLDIDGNGSMNQQEAEGVTRICVDCLKIGSLKGIEHFTSLTKLSCWGNELTALDVSRNTALKVLDCSYNQLTALDVSRNTALEELDCGGNRLIALDVSKNTALKKLNCMVNQLTALDVRKNTALKELVCHSNQLSSLDVRMNIELVDLTCYNNQLSSLDMTRNTALESLDCSSNQLTALDVSKNTVLSCLSCIHNQLRKLDVSHCPVLVDLISKNDPGLDGDYSVVTWFVDWEDEGRIDIMLQVDTNVLIPGYTEDTVAINITNFPDAVFREYVKQFDRNGSGGLSCTEIAAARQIDLYYRGVESLQGIEYFTHLTHLFCSGNSLTQLDLSKNTALIVLECDNNQLTALNVGGNTTLRVLSCCNNQFSTLDVSHCPVLADLILEHDPEVIDDSTQVWTSDGEFEDGYNEIVLRTDTDVTINTAGHVKYVVAINETNFPDAAFRKYVQQLDSNQNGLFSQDELDAVTDINVNELGIKTLKGIKYFSSLKNLNCSCNELKGLNVSRNKALTTLNCMNNQLDNLDVSENTALEYLQCSGNALITLDVSQNTALRCLECRSMSISALDVSYNSELEYLDCAYTNIGALDVSSNSKLDYLDCSFTTISKLDISQNTKLAKLCCAMTNLAELDISKCFALVKLVNENEAEEDFLTLNWVIDPDGNGEYDSMLWVNKNVKLVPEPTSEPASTPVPVPEPKPDPGEKIEAYVTRCYSVILGREPDPNGLETWFNELTSGRKTASEIIDRFVNSKEFVDKQYTDGEAVDILYRAMLGRNADAGGKANWVKKLENGQTLAHVINGFCFSKEFRDLCDSYGIKAGFVNIPNTDTTAEGKIKAFVQRCYRIILDREADPSGMQTWYEQLSSGKKAAAEIIDRFVNSPEFSGKNYNSSDSVEILYKAMLGRGSDAAGKANWVGKLDAGQPFAVVINGFCVSKEFTGICDSYGIKPGSVTITPLSGIAEEEALSMLAYKAKEPITKKFESNPTRVEIINPSDTIDLNIGTAVQAVYINEEKAKEFISRCYQCILGREASASELDNWIGQMTNGTKTPDQIARGFLFSNEFKGRNVSNEDLVKILYKIYMNRDADPEGLKTWTEKLDNGTSLNDLLNTFSKTGEFKKVVSEMSK